MPNVNIPDGYMIISALAALKLHQAGHLKPEDMLVMNIAGSQHMKPTAVEPSPLLPVSFEIDGIPWECPAEKGVLVPVDIFEDVSDDAEDVAKSSVVFVHLPSTYGYLCPNDEGAISYARALIRDDVRANILQPEAHGSIFDLCEVASAPGSTLADVCWELFWNYLPEDDE